MIIPAELDLTIYRGATYSRQFQWATGEPPVPVDMTGASIAMHVRPDVQSRHIFLSASTENDRFSLENASEGRFRLLLPAPLTDLLDFDAGVYDVLVTLPDETVWVLLRGNVSLVQRVTR